MAANINNGGVSIMASRNDINEEKASVKKMANIKYGVVIVVMKMTSIMKAISVLKA